MDVKIGETRYYVQWIICLLQIKLSYNVIMTAGRASWKRFQFNQLECYKEDHITKQKSDKGRRKNGFRLHINLNNHSVFTKLDSILQ
jgi:hypothetical protein